MSAAQEISIFTQRQGQPRLGQGRIMRIQGRNATELEFRREEKSLTNRSRMRAATSQERQKVLD